MEPNTLIALIFIIAAAVVLLIEGICYLLNLQAEDDVFDGWLTSILD
jgi:hypothetical protein